MDIVNYRVSVFMEHNPECMTCEYRTLCCGGCRAAGTSSGTGDHPADYLAKDELTCKYFKDDWKEKKDELLRKINQSV